MEGAVGEPQSQNLELRISRKDILELSDENVIEGNDEVKILHIFNCENLVEAQEKILGLNFQKFPKVFVILIKLLNESEDDDIDELQEIILSKFTDNSRPLLVELSSVNFTEFYYKRRNDDDFLSVVLDVPKQMLKKKIDKSGMTCDALLLIMKSTLLYADLNKVFEYFIKSEIHPLMHAINTGDELCYRLIDLFDLNLIEDFKDEILLHTIEFKKFDLLLAFFNAFNESQVTQLHINKILSLKCGVKSQNAFMMTIETKNLQLTKLLMGFSANFPDFFNFNLLEEALNAIKKREFFEVLPDLKFSKFNLTPEEVKKKKTLVLECENLLSEISKLKSSIKGKKIDEIKDFAKENPDLRLCYGKSEVCALELAIDSKFFNIYALLRSLGFYTDKGAEFDRKIMKLPDEERKIIRDENMKHFVSNPEAFIGIIQSKCTFEPQSPIASSDVREMLHDLNRFDEISSTYPTVAHSNVQINFDFKTKTIHVMDPLQDVSALGVAYNETGILYLALNDSKNQRFGTFAHELMHLVLHLVYENNCLPYCEDDTEREAEWTKIVENLSEYCEKNPKTEEIIQLVFRYHKCKWFIEMAVRVNDMLAFYRDNDEKIIELVGLHPELFSYMREKVLLDLKIPNVYRMIKLNNDFGLIQKINDSKLQVKPTENSEILNLTTEQSIKILIVTNVPQLMLSKVCNEVKGLPGNKLNLKVKNLYLNSDSLTQLHLKLEFMNLTKNNDVNRVIIDLQKLQEENLKVICELERELFFVVSKADSRAIEFLTKESTSYEQHAIDIQWQDLTEKTHEFILEKSIKFQELTTNLSQIDFEARISITPEMLTILCSDDEIKINCESRVEKLVKFIERTVQMKKKVKVNDVKESMMKLGTILDQGNEFYEEESDSESGTSSAFKSKKVKFTFIREDISLENFIDETQNEQILVISDIAGSGKTTLLSKIYEILRQKFQLSLTYFVSLKDFFNELSQGVGESFTEFIASILEFNSLEKQIFMQKSLKGEVKILFDAFDEISPKCKENTTKLFQLFDKNSKNQIFITTRTHLKHNLEKDLKVFAHSIKILTKEEQIKFLEESWEGSDRDLVKKCANLLIDKISEVISSKPSLIGVPLIIQGLAEAFKDKIDENFEREILNLDFLNIYEKIVETSFKILSTRFPQKPVENQGKSMNPLLLHQFVAICLFFSEELANSLGLNLDEDEWPVEEFARCGLIKYDKDGKFHFNHQTYAEYFIAVFIFHLLKTVKKLSPVQLDFIFEVLTSEKFQITRMFLDSMLNRVENVQDLKSFNSSREICEKVKNDKHFLKFCVREKLLNIFEYFSLAIKKSDLKLFKEVIEHKEITIELRDEDDFEATNLMRILPYATNLTKFEIFFDEILNFYSENIFDDFLLKVSKDGSAIFHYFAAICSNKHIIKCFWNKIKVFFTNEAKLKSFLLIKGRYETNALQRSIGGKNENTFYFLFEELYCKFFNIKDFSYENAAPGENLLHFLARWGSISMIKFTLEKLKTEFSAEDFQNFLKSKSKNGQNMLHCAGLQNQNEKSVEFLVNFTENELGIEEFKKMLSELDDCKSVPLQYAAPFHKFFFSLYEKSFSQVQIFEFVRAKDVHGFTSLHLAAALSKSKEDFELSWMKIEKLSEDKEELKEFLLVKGYLERNAFLWSIAGKNENTFYFLFEQVFCKYFNINDFAYETDEDGNNLLHFLARQGSVSMLKFALEKLKTEFSPDDFQNFVKIKNKTGHNLLHLAAERNKNEKSVEFLVNFTENELGREELIKMLSELDLSNNLPLHCAVIFNNSIVFEFFFSIYEICFDQVHILQFLHTKDEYGDNFLHRAAALSKSKEVFEFTWMKIKKLIDDKEELKEFLLVKGQFERNALLKSVVATNENTFYFLFEQAFCKFFNIKDFAYENGKNWENFFHFLVRFGSVSMLKFALEKLKAEFSAEDFQIFIKLKRKNGHNILHCAALQNENESSLEFLVNFIEDEISSEEIKKMLSELDLSNNLPLHCAVIFNNLIVCEFFFSIYEKTFEQDHILEFLRAKDENGNNFLHRAASFAKSKEVFEFTWMKIEKLIDDKGELKEFLLVKGYLERNALMKSIAYQNENSFYSLYEQAFCKFFSIKDFADETDEDGENLLHYLARWGSVSMLKFALEKLKAEFSAEDFQNFLELKNKNGQNMLHCAGLQNQNVKSVEFFVDFIKDEIGSKKIKKMLSDHDNFSFYPFHYARKSKILKVLDFRLKFMRKRQIKWPLYRFSNKRRFH